MDGTLVDTEGLWWQAVREVAARLGHRLREADIPDVLGRPVEHTAAHLHRVTGGNQSCETIRQSLDVRFATLVSTQIHPMPGALALLDALAADHVPLGLVSASPRTLVDIVLGVLGANRFAVSMAAGETSQTKPAPDRYLAAARNLGAAPATCVAVEDTPVGVASAEAAGCFVLAVPSLTPIHPAPGRAVVDSLTEADPRLLRALVDGD